MDSSNYYVPGSGYSGTTVQFDSLIVSSELLMASSPNRRNARLVRPDDLLLAANISDKYKKTGPNLLAQIFSVRDLESSSLAGFFPHIWSICARATF
jgi:hypothetical protein